jgi:hypothetical protein
MNPTTLLTAPIPRHRQPPFPNNSANGTFLMDEETDDEYSLYVTLPAKRKFQTPVNETRELSIARPITTAIDTANALLHASSNASADFKFRHTLVSQALAIGRSLSVEIVNPLSVVRPHAQEIQSTKELLLYSHSAMIQILCHHNYVAHRELIHNHIKHIIRLQGHKMLYRSDPRIGVMWPTIISCLGNLKWTIPQRMREWIQIASTVPTDDYFVANRFFSHHSCVRMEMDNVETCLAEGNLNETMEAITVMQYPIDIFTRCMEIISSVEGRKFLPQVREWKDPQHYCKLGEEMLTRYSKIKRDVETRILLRQGDTLLNIATDRVRETNADYFRFQAMLALDAYRMAYQRCIACEETNFDLEGFCLWSMGRVLGKYLGLEEHAHDLLLRAVAMVTIVSALLPTSEWYTDAVEQIQQYRKKLEDEALIYRQRERAGILDQLTVELFELHSQAERVFDEYSLREFFQWLLRTHRPRYSSKTEIGGDILESRELSKVVLNVIAVYDVPDKHVCDDLWMALSEEIIKVRIIL